MTKLINQPFDSWKRVTLKDVRLVGLARRGKIEPCKNLSIHSIKRETITFYIELFNNEEGD